MEIDATRATRRVPGTARGAEEEEQGGDEEDKEECEKAGGQEGSGDFSEGPIWVC